jgi:hypothetical protein
MGCRDQLWPYVSMRVDVGIALARTNVHRVSESHILVSASVIRGRKLEGL